MASANDFFQYVGIPGTATTLSAPGYTTGVSSSITVVSTSNWPTGSGTSFAIDRVNSSGVQIPGTYCEFRGLVASATSITSLSLVTGTPQTYAAGTTTRVYIPVSSSRENRLVDGMLVQHTQDGKHANTITTNTINENTTNNGVTIDGLSIKDGKVATAGALSPVFTVNPHKFSAYASATVNISATNQKVVLNTEIFDTGNNFDNTTNYRFTAPVAGFYWFSGQVGVGNAGMVTTETAQASLYKNGAAIKVSQLQNGSDTNTLLPRLPVSAFVQLVAGDYIELYVNMGGIYREIVGNSNITYLEGFLVSAT